MDDVLAHCGLFQGLPAEVIEPIAAGLETIALPAGGVVFVEGEHGDSLYIVLSGKVSLSRRSPDGGENVLALVRPFDQFGELSAIDPGPCRETATTITDVTLARLGHPVLRPWIESHPEVGERLLRALARRLWPTHPWIADLFFTDAPGRLARVLLQLADKFGSWDHDGLRIRHDLTVEKLARLVGASRETVSRALDDFAHRGWIRTQGTSIVILDERRLRRRAR